jgi:ribosomal protein S18 acetylase RimI-like enzyme
MRNTKDNFSITDDIATLDMEFVINALHNTYWAEKRSQGIIEESISNSVVISLFDGNKQIGLARIVSDFATFAYICDVYIDPDYRQRGLGVWLMQHVMEHPATQVNLITLATRDAHGLYQKFGFTQNEEIAKKFMLKRNDCGKLNSCLGKM